MAGRKKASPAQPGSDLQIVERTPPAMAAQEIAAREAGEFVSIDQAMGWMQVSGAMSSIASLQFMRQVADRATAEQYVAIKKSKAYVGAPYVDGDGALRQTQTLDEFCRARLGKSYRRCEELAANLELLGGELYDAAQKMGLGQRDYNALKVLPADDQEVIRQAIAEGGDRDAVVGMLTQLVERQAVEKAELKATLDAKDEVAAKKAARITRLEEDLSKVRREWKKKDADERVAALQNAVTEAKLGVIADLSLGDPEGGLNGAILELLGDDSPEQDHTEFLAGVFAEIITAARQLRDNLPITVPVRESRK